jgi:hypothetical protein
VSNEGETSLHLFVLSEFLLGAIRVDDRTSTAGMSPWFLEFNESIKQVHSSVFPGQTDFPFSTYSHAFPLDGCRADSLCCRFLLDLRSIAVIVDKDKDACLRVVSRRLESPDNSFLISFGEKSRFALFLFCAHLPNFTQVLQTTETHALQ